MSGWLAVLAWALAASLLHARGRRRLVLAARAGHEIRGPLCAARLALEGLERSARVQAIDLELRRAALALDDLAGMGAGRHVGAFVEPVDVGRLFRESAPAWRALANAHGGELVVETPHARVVVIADPLRLAQACANLVANAAEHGGERVTVRARAAVGRVRVEVCDDGPGLPAPVPDLVAAARGRRSSRGHGLAIAASIAGRHGGRLTSAPSTQGARLVLELPEAPVASHSSSALTNSSPAAVPSSSSALTNSSPAAVPSSLSALTNPSRAAAPPSS